MSALQQVHVRVNDAATGKPTPCRVRFTDAAGRYYAPYGRLTEFATDMGVDVGGNIRCEEEFAYIDGTCEIALPIGPIHVAIHKGPEYLPVDEEVYLIAGKLSLRFGLQRWIDMRAQQWYSGDTRTHFLTPHGGLLEGAAEDVAVVNLLVWECPALANILAFSGQKPILETPGHMVVVNTFNVHRGLGQLLLLNCHRVVYPLTAGGPDGFDDWALADWCDQCHRKGGLVIGEGFFGHWPGYDYGELLADLILGKIDALQLNDIENPAADARFEQESPLKEWYALLDGGFRVPLAGGSGKDCNLVTLGSMRTYARLMEGQTFNYKNWIEAVRSGRTFVTTGPLLNFAVNDCDPGSVIRIDSDEATVRVQARVQSLTPLDRLEVVANNTVVASAIPEGPRHTAQIDTNITMPTAGWIVARCWGVWDEGRDGWSGAQSSPVYIAVKGATHSVNHTSIRGFLGHLEKMLSWVDTKGRFQNNTQRLRLRKVFEDAIQLLQQRAAT